MTCLLNSKTKPFSEATQLINVFRFESIHVKYLMIVARLSVIYLSFSISICNYRFLVTFLMSLNANFTVKVATEKHI